MAVTPVCPRSTSRRGGRSAAETRAARSCPSCVPALRAWRGLLGQAGGCVSGSPWRELSAPQLRGAVCMPQRSPSFSATAFSRVLFSAAGRVRVQICWCHFGSLLLSEARSCGLEALFQSTRAWGVPLLGRACHVHVVRSRQDFPLCLWPACGIMRCQDRKALAVWPSALSPAWVPALPG